MPEVSVLIDLPDGWELADKKMRLPRAGEWAWGWNDTTPVQVKNDYCSDKYVIVRPKQPEYVQVKVPTNDVRAVVDKGYAVIGDYPLIGTRYEAACREALANKACPGYWHPQVPDVSCDRGIRYNEYRHLDGTGDHPCPQEMGHKGEHGPIKGVQK